MTGKKSITLVIFVKTVEKDENFIYNARLMAANTIRNLGVQQRSI